jgi:hypothetical protein
MTTKAAHTPGPWHAFAMEINKRTHRTCSYVSGESGISFAEVHGNNGSREANARLIAAAPDYFSAVDEFFSRGMCPETVKALKDAHRKAGGVL